MNRVILMGNLGREPELKRTTNDIAVTSFSLAVKRPFAKDTTDWIDCVAWRQNAEFISRYFTRGQQILIEGSVQTRTYEDKNGNKRKAIEVVVDRAEFCGDKKPAQDNSAPAADDFEVITLDDDLPF